MAFIKIDKKDGEQYIRIVGSKRKDGKPTHQTIYSLGKVSDYTPEQLKRFGTKFYELGGGDPKELLKGSVEEIGRYNYGYFQLYNKVLSFYKLDKLLQKVTKKHRLEINLLNAVLLMLIERLHSPSSKRQNYFNQQEYLGITSLELHHLYRGLDYLSAYSKEVQQHIYQPNNDLFNQEFDVVFYDVTTFYFESDIEHEGALRQKGFGKDGKIGNTQILFGLLVDKHKQPIGYRIYKGDTFEGHTFENALLQLKQQYQIKNIVLVADRGMLNKNNIQLVENNQYEFILGERLKSLPKSVQNQLINLHNYQKTWVYDKDGQLIVIKYCTLSHAGKTIIGTYSENRALKDRSDREERLEKAQKLLKHPEPLKRKAYHYFLKSEKNETYALNEEKIKQHEKYDGFLAIASNTKNMTVEQILDNYRHLYQIEHSFRTFKSYLETRPMFHWTDKRIEGHICLCYIAYTLLTYTQNKLIKSGVKISENELRKAMDTMQVSYIRNKKDYFYLRSASKENVDAIINKLGIKKLPNIIPEREILSYL